MADDLLEKLERIQRQRMGLGPRPDGSIGNRSWRDMIKSMASAYMKMPEGLRSPGEGYEPKGPLMAEPESFTRDMMRQQDILRGEGGADFVDGNPRNDRLSALPPVEATPRQVGHPQRSVGSMSFDDISGGLKDSTLDMLPRLNRGANGYIGHDISAGQPQNYDKSLGALNRSGSRQGYGYSQTVNADGQMRFATPPGVGSIHAPGLNRSHKGFAFDRRETDPLTRGQEAAARYGLTELGVNEGIKTDAALQNHFTPHSNVDPTQDAREAQTWDAMINREPNMANRGVADYARNRHFGGEVLQRGYASASQPQLQSGPTAVAGITPPAPQPAVRPQGTGQQRPMSMTAYAGMPSQAVGSSPPQLSRAQPLAPDIQMSLGAAPPSMMQPVPPPASIQAATVSETPMMADPGRVAMLDVTRSPLPPIKQPTPPPQAQGAFASGPPSVPPPPTLPPVQPQMTFQVNPSIPQVQATTPGFDKMMPQVAREVGPPSIIKQSPPVYTAAKDIGSAPSEMVASGGFESMPAQPSLDSTPSRLAQFSPPQGAFAPSAPPPAPPTAPTIAPTIAPHIAAAPPSPSRVGQFAAPNIAPSIPSGGMPSMGGMGGGGGGGMLGGLGGIASAIAGNQQAKAEAAQQQNQQVHEQAMKANEQMSQWAQQDQAAWAAQAKKIDEYYQQQDRMRLLGLA